MSAFWRKRYACLASVGLTVLLFSCLGIELETVFHEDGSGTMTMKFVVSKELLDMGEEQSGVGIPFTKEDLEDEFGSVEGVTVEEIFQEDTETDRIITAKLAFENFNDLSRSNEFPGEEASLSTNGNLTVFRMLMGQPRGDAGEGAAAEMPEMAEMDEAMTAMIQSFLEGYTVEYRITAPKKIVKYSHGELSKDKKTISFFMSMGDFIMIEEPYFLEVVW